MGRYPHGFGVHWSKVDYVYGVAHVCGNHWVLFNLDFPQQEIRVYDSLSNDKPMVCYMSEFTRLAAVLPSICVEAGVPINSPNPFRLRRQKKPPQQLNGHDCGIMAIKFLECLVSGSPLERIEPNFTHEYRLRFCCELFDKNNICL